MSDEIMIPDAVVLQGSSTAIDLSDSSDTYGRTLKNSALCTVCRHTRKKDINLRRARDHRSLDDISKEFSIPPTVLKTHFDSHYILNSYHNKVIKLEEEGSSEARELVTALFDGNNDILKISESVLISKGERLNIIKNRIKAMSDGIEIDSLDEGEKVEFISLNKEAEKIENSIMEVMQVIDKKLFPFKKDELSNAILSYKLRNLRSMMNEVKFILIEFKKRQGMKTYQDFVDEVALELAKRFNKLEEEVYSSGGVMQG